MELKLARQIASFSRSNGRHLTATCIQIQNNIQHNPERKGL